MTSVISRLFGKFTFLPCHRLLWIVNASIVTVKCFVCTWVKHLLPELYLNINNLLMWNRNFVTNWNNNRYSTYLKNLSNISSVTSLGPIPDTFITSSVSGKYEYKARYWQPASRKRMRKCFVLVPSDLVTSSISRFFLPRFTSPGNTQYSIAFIIIPRFDLTAGCLYNLQEPIKLMKQTNRFQSIWSKIYFSTIF